MMGWREWASVYVLTRRENESAEKKILYNCVNYAYSEITIKN